MIDNRTFWRTVFGFSFFITLWALVLSTLRWVELGVVLYRSIWGIALLLYVVALVLSAGLAWRADLSRLLSWQSARFFEGIPARFAAGLFFVATFFLLPWLKFTLQNGRFVTDSILAMAVFYWLAWWLVVLAAVAVTVAFRTSLPAGFAIALLSLGVVYEAYGRLLVVTSYPFSLGWSEGSRYYYASLPFSPRIYGERFPWSVWHPTRYFLQSIPFAFSNFNLWFHRLWQALLWMILTAVAALSLARRLKIEKSLSFFLLVGWLFLYFLRIGIYYHLQVMVILIFWGVRRDRPWLSLLTILLASLWAGMSRLNWYPVPALLAITLYLLETPLAAHKQRWRYFFLPVLWGVLGLTTAFLGQALYVRLSGNSDLRAFASSLTSDLLWYRLLPNATYPPGVLPALLIVTFPLLWLVLGLRHGEDYPLHWLRKVALITILTVLLIGGAVVSVKIGGGGDLHNMDAFALLLVVTALYLFFRRFAADEPPTRSRPVPWAVLAFGLITPLVFLINTLSPLPAYDLRQGEQTLADFRTAIQPYARRGEVLFITQRHLLTFGLIPQVRTIPDYEVITLMEMAMSHNQPYLRQFYADLQQHRFAAIVAGPQSLRLKESDQSFAEENNAWNTAVARYLLCYYQPDRTFETETGDVVIFVPAPNPTDACQP
jgi:hypothetical protein